MNHSFIRSTVKKLTKLQNNCKKIEDFRLLDSRLLDSIINDFQKLQDFDDLEERCCRWCNEQKKCMNIDIECSEYQNFKLPICKDCILTSSEYSYLSKRFT